MIQSIIPEKRFLIRESWRHNISLTSLQILLYNFKFTNGLTRYVSEVLYQHSTVDFAWCELIRLFWVQRSCVVCVVCSLPPLIWKWNRNTTNHCTINNWHNEVIDLIDGTMIYEHRSACLHDADGLLTSYDSDFFPLNIAQNDEWRDDPNRWSTLLQNET